MADFQEEYKRLKEEVASLSARKNTLERQLKDAKALKKQKVDLQRDIKRLEAELRSLDS